MISSFFDRWETRLASVDTNRVVRPFEWGFDWLTAPVIATDSPVETFTRHARELLADSAGFFDLPPIDAFELRGEMLRFPSAVQTPYEVNNTVVARVFPAEVRPGRRRRAVIVLPQ